VRISISSGLEDGVEGLAVLAVAVA